jgi:hypothetical protein
LVKRGDYLVNGILTCGNCQTTARITLADIKFTRQLIGPPE